MLSLFVRGVELLRHAPSTDSSVLRLLLRARNGTLDGGGNFNAVLYTVLLGSCQLQQTQSLLPSQTSSTLHRSETEVATLCLSIEAGGEHPPPHLSRQSMVLLPTMIIQ